ncbi:MAG: pantetheine-phosphate adenylyltransferase [Nitrospiraceae bacterium]|nr:pantetheine-phosphate adenylyltransferase [Nitrospiraceae bacterium]
MTSSTAIYPGSFDPPTWGHVDLIRRAVRIFDTVTVAVTTNYEKRSLFTVKERVEMLQAITSDLPGARVASFHGLTVDFAQECNARAIVRGLRAISDFEFEHSMAVTNQKLNEDVDTVCLMPSEAYLFLSSRVVKEVASFGGDVSPFVPPLVAERLREKFGEHKGS